MIDFFSKKIPNSFLLLFIVYLLGASFQSAFSQSFELLFQEGEKCESAFNEKAAFEKYIDAQKVQPNNLKVLYKCSELAGRIGSREKSTASQSKYFQAALNFASYSLKLYPKSDEANVLMAIALGQVALLKNPKEKINKVLDLKKYADIALQLNPQNSIAWYVLGKWHFEFSNLNVFEKVAIGFIKNDIPPYSFERARAAFERAQQLNPLFIMNAFDLAKTYLQTNQKSKAKSILESLLQFPSRTENDLLVKQSANQLLRDF